MKLLAFAIGATTAGRGRRGLRLHAPPTSTPTRFDILTSFLLVAAVVIGGMGNIKGAIAGAFIITGLPPLVQLRFSHLDQYRYLAFGALLVVDDDLPPPGAVPLQATGGRADRVGAVHRGGGASS